MSKVNTRLSTLPMYKANLYQLRICFISEKKKENNFLMFGYFIKIM